VPFGFGISWLLSSCFRFLSFVTAPSWLHSSLSRSQPTVSTSTPHATKSCVTPRAARFDLNAVISSLLFSVSGMVSRQRSGTISAPLLPLEKER
jgi:hypothetical protein